MDHTLSHEEARFVREYLATRDPVGAYMTVWPDADRRVASRKSLRLLARPDIKRAIEDTQQKADQAVQAVIEGGQKIQKVAAEVAALAIPEVAAISAEKMAALRAYIASMGSREALLYRTLRIVEACADVEPSTALKAIDLAARMQGMIVDQRRVTMATVRDLPDEEVMSRLRRVLMAVPRGALEDSEIVNQPS